MTFKKNLLQPNFTSIHGCRPGARVVCLWGHTKFWRGHKNIYGNEDQKKDLYCKFISVTSILFLSFRGQFSLRGTFSLGGTNASFGMHFAQNSGSKIQKIKIKKDILRKYTPMVSVLLLSFGARFLLG